MDEQLARTVLARLSVLDSRLSALDRDVHAALQKMDELEDRQHEHSKEMLILKGQRELESIVGPVPAHGLRHPKAVVGGGVAAGGLLALLIDRLIVFLFGL